MSLLMTIPTHPILSRILVAGAVVFDLIRIWRVDSGDYCSIAHAIKLAWQARSRENLDRKPLPEPQFMNSNLSSAEDIMDASK